MQACSVRAGMHGQQCSQQYMMSYDVCECVYTPSLPQEMPSSRKEQTLLLPLSENLINVLINVPLEVFLSLYLPWSD